VSVFIVVFLKAERVVVLGSQMFYGIQRSEVLKNFKKLSENGPRLYDALIRVYDAAANVIETQEQAGDFKEP
jgi:hypothetical protein